MQMIRLLVGIFLLLFLLGQVSGQGRLVLNNDVCLVISGGAQLVIDNSNSNAIATTGAGGNIISEGEFNRVKWNISSSTGVYTVPFSKSISEKIPLAFTIVNGGSAGGGVLFSTYGGLGWNNLLYMPSDVLHMYNNFGVNNSSFVIDRFWNIEPINYSTKPEGNLTFTYLDSEWNPPGNTISESAFFAQRYNPAPFNQWGDWFGVFGTANTITNTANSGFISNSNFHRSWTLSDQDSPLPIELLDFSAMCAENGKRLFRWITMSEIQNQSFTIQGSADAIEWSNLKTVAGAGNSNSTIHYIESANVSPIQNYFRLQQTDFDGGFSFSKIIFVQCRADNNQQINIYPNPTDGIINLEFRNDISHSECLIEIFNQQGELITKAQNIIHNLSIVNLTRFSSGIYTFKLTASEISSYYKIVKL